MAKGELWSHLNEEMEQDLNLDNIVPLVVAEDGVAQYDVGITPTVSCLMCVTIWTMNLPFLMIS